MRYGTRTHRPVDVQKAAYGTKEVWGAMTVIERPTVTKSAAFVAVPNL